MPTQTDDLTVPLDGPITVGTIHEPETADTEFGVGWEILVAAT
jgi:hypothetical protein